MELPESFGFHDHLGVSSSRVKTDLECVVEQINSSKFLLHSLQEELDRSVIRIYSNHSPVLTFTPYAVFLKALCFMTVRMCWMWFRFSQRSSRVIGFISGVTNRHIKFSYSSRITSQNFLYSVTHIKKRLESVANSFLVYSAVTRQDSLPSLAREDRWVFLWSFIMVTVVDVLLGCIFGMLLMRYHLDVYNFGAAFFATVKSEVILKTIIWFNSSPGGVKLNPMLTARIGEALEISVQLFGEFVYAFIIHYCRSWCFRIYSAVNCVRRYHQICNFSYKYFAIFVFSVA
jgi:hypothetical protein